MDTIAVPSVLAAYNWAPNTERRRKLALFVDAFFTKFPALQNPPFHPKWKEVSLPAPLAGWNRLPLAQQWLDKHGVEPVKRQRFEAFLQENPAARQHPVGGRQGSTYSGNFRRRRRSGTRGRRWARRRTPRRFENGTVPPNPQRKPPLRATTRAADRILQGGYPVA